MRTVDYDELDKWGPWVGDAITKRAITKRAGRRLIQELSRSAPEYIEDARDWLYNRLGGKYVVDAVSRDLNFSHVRLFHGTRLTDAELDQVRREGLKPLRLADRMPHIADVFQTHPRWGEVKAGLAEAVQAFGPGAEAGLREDGCVHFCFSRSSLLLGCSHYLTHGAEVDNHIGYRLFGDHSASRLLRENRKPYLISCDVPFEVAAQGSHALGELEGGRTILTNMLVGAWAYRQAHESFRVTTQMDCSAAKIKGVIPPDRLKFEAVDDAHLAED